MPTPMWTGAWRGNKPDAIAHQRSREVVAPTGGIMRGKFPSRKNGRMVHHEGLLELDAVHLFEVSPNILRYIEQPRQYRYPDGDKVRKYTPDFELTLKNGTKLLVEVKGETSLKYPEIRHKLRCLEAYFRKVQIPFVVLTDQVLRAEPQQSNARTLWRRAPAHRMPMLSAIAVHERIKHLFPMSVSDAVELLAARGCDPYTLIFYGLLGCDLQVPFTAATILFNQTGGSNDWLRISQEFGI